MKKVMITGCSGYIGSHLCKMLEGKYEEATEAGMRALAEVKLTLTAIKDAQEKVKK